MRERAEGEGGTKLLNGQQRQQRWWSDSSRATEREKGRRDRLGCLGWLVGWCCLASNWIERKIYWEKINLLNLFFVFDLFFFIILRVQSVGGTWSREEEHEWYGIQLRTFSSHSRKNASHSLAAAHLLLVFSPKLFEPFLFDNLGFSGPTQNIADAITQLSHLQWNLSYLIIPSQPQVHWCIMPLFWWPQ